MATTESDETNVKPDALKTSLMPALYVVPTPIGNLRDITLRALDVLGGCDTVYAEDTRVAVKLLKAFGLAKPVQRYDEHTHDKTAAAIIAAIQKGGRIALVSDAGTPAISDPGQYLVQTCRAANVPVIALPGASAVITALSGAGLPTQAFCFLGFLPNKTKARQDALRDYIGRRDTMVLFESATRIAALVDDIIAVMGTRRMIAVARELTKKFEEYLIGPASDVKDKIAAHTTLKGEIVVLISGVSADSKDETVDIEQMLRDALKTHSVRDAAEMVAKATGMKKQQIYQQALQINGKSR